MSEKKFIPQFIPYWDQKEIDAVHKVLESDYLNEYKTVREFEKKFAEFVGAKYCVTCTSGSTALYLASKALMQKEKLNEIYIPDYAGIFVANATTQANLKINLADVGQNGSMIDDIEPRFVVHSNGRMGNTWMVEDCAQTISHHTKNCMSCYSFASTKHLTTSGQGGAICCDDEETFDILIRLKDHGRNDRQKLKPMSDYFEFWGTNSKFTEIQAAFGLAQLEKLPKRLQRLKEMYKIIHDEITNLNWVEFLAEQPTWYLDILVPDPQKILEHLKKFNIQVRRFYTPLHEQPLYKTGGKFENTDNLFAHGIWLPSTTNLTDEEVLFVADTIKKFK